MDEICKFLTHMEQPRLLDEGDFEEEEGVVRSEEDKNELREKILLGVKRFLFLDSQPFLERRSLWNV